MERPTGFGLEVSQNPYLSTEDDEMHAALVVTGAGALPDAAAPEVAQVVLVDCSGSMSYPTTKIAAARTGTKAAIDALRDGALFAVVKGNDIATAVYPDQGLARADASTRRAAKDRVNRLDASGGTVIAAWLELAERLLSEYPTAVRHAILLTDGHTFGVDELDRVLRRCESVFSCDARGIGVDWRPDQLLRIAEVLHGTADAIRQPADLGADFTAMTEAAMAKLVPELRIAVRTSTGSRLDFLRQTHPVEAELRGTPVDERTTEFTTGSWGAERREFHLKLTVDPDGRQSNTNVRIARVDLRVRAAGETGYQSAAEPRAVIAHWTDDVKLSSGIDPKIAHYTGQGQLSAAVRAGTEAHDRGDLDGAAAGWGRAVALATGLGNDAVLRRLHRLVEVVGDPADGVVRVKDDLDVEDLLAAAVGSALSSRSPDSDVDADPPPVPSGPDVTCPRCGRQWPSGSVFCGGCATRLDP
ncbi:Ca-activated chloride channel family protein [Actinokineospora baliensis]|uniref:VWA domain-containing protein n=1 Tax=Actinokineospora baliensis TaxID=547056 RepID=UPI00195BBC40|nr:VWA domain-containing protein [Actinokineospora baliensis]MBM7774360.1 Ca-activated chloride channel family protein [Actinokineospora baliensis]